MSDSFSASENTSPVSSVRSSEAPTYSSHVSGTASPSKPKAITPTTSAQYNGPELPSCQSTNEDKDIKQLSYQAGNHTGFHEDDSSDPNTPRLPPTAIGNNDLESIPKEEAIHLDNVDKAFLTTSTPFNRRHSHLSHGPSSKPSSSTSEPITPGLGSQRYTQEAARPIEVQDESVRPLLLEKPPQDTRPLPNSVLPSHSPRTVPNGPHHSSQMSGSWGQEVGSTSGGGERSAREEAFSEKRHRSSSRSSQSRVEKRIEATLADAEPSSHANSRKSSHTLGLFKETTATASQGLKRGQERSRTISANAVDASAVLDNHTMKQRTPSRSISIFENVRHQDGEIGSSEGALSMLGKQENDVAEDESPSQSFPQSSRPTSRPGADLPTSSRSDSDIAAEDSERKGVTPPSKKSDAAKHNVPTRLLEEIRNYHNLTAPFHDKFRTTQPKHSSPTQDKHDAENLSRRQDAMFGDQDHRAPVTEAETKGEPENEEDESEQISSALYYPHQAPSPDALEDVSIDDARKIKEASTEVETSLPEPALSPENETERSEDVDIALQMHNKNRYFHGDLSKAHALSMEAEDKQASESDASSASESEYESQDENKRPGMQDESSLTDDGGATPRASPNTRESWIISRSRKTHRGPAAPLGAVELKPYNHQVGGHTNLFRFSKRAVCKQLSNRENEFYEVVERQHPELLKFLPKYDYFASCPVPYAEQRHGITLFLHFYYKKCTH